ncbi:MAG: DEAD/DEAH box helicase [Desulfobacterales bacterium]|nr:DEAD/DEAH box helicase [Desulfobacterales bacterium]
MLLSPQEKILLYKSLFKGREDVFAIRWEKADKSASGYVPVCLNEWKPGFCIKLNKGKCKDCINKNYAKFADFYIEQHLRGEKFFGIYPLLDDNTSFFIVADFDGEKWTGDATNFMSICKSSGFSTYLERSRSGNGGHVWLFFAENYPAFKSRTIIFHLLKEAKIIGQFDKEDSFDRLFPNQDYRSGRGFGNLIALPLHGLARKKGNTVFVNPEIEYMPYPDQWDLLANISRIPTDILDKFFQDIKQRQNSEPIKKNSKIVITYKNQLDISKSYLPKNLITFLKENLNFINSDYIIKRRLGLNVYGLEKYFKMIDGDETSVIVPRGFLTNLTNFLQENEIQFQINDMRSMLKQVNFTSEITLFGYQKDALEIVLKSDQGILVAPPGTGKTIIGLELISRLKQPSLILVHKKQIFDQWLERIENFLVIPKREIGQFSSGKRKIGKKITVGMVQTLIRMDDLQNMSNSFGLILVDECHHMPAKMFRNVITKFNPYYLYGLTATPERKSNDAQLIFIHLGKVLHEIKEHAAKDENLNEQFYKKPIVFIRNSDLSVPFNVMTDNFNILSKIISFDSKRNDMIKADIEMEAKRGNKCLVLTERKEHVEVLSYYLKRNLEIIILTGDLSPKQRKQKIRQIESGNFQVLLATGQLIGEGTDFPNLDCLFLVFPFAFRGKLIQYIGRIHRGTEKGVVYDYRDLQIDFLEKLFKQRFRYYKKNFEINEKPIL